MCKILIFGGTTEGRLLAEFCDKEGIPVTVNVVSDYGKDLMKESACVEVNVSSMDEAEMEHFLQTGQIGLVVDATHPYAVSATENIRQACKATNVRLLRCLRDGSLADEKPEESRRTANAQEKNGVVFVSSVQEAAFFLKGKEGNVLVTTGSNELVAFTKLADYKERVYARVLPSREAIGKAEALGIEKSHLIGMQGPFPEEMNVALIHRTGAAYLVTKEAGAAGGFSEKLRAAALCGITAVVVSRPPEAEGVSVEEACAAMAEFAASLHKAKDRPSVSLVGIGPGALSQMTGAAVQAVRDSGVLFGAPRVLRAVKPLLTGEQVTVERYLASDVAEWLEDKSHPSFEKAALLFSGDSGFYSGARSAANYFREKRIPFTVIPGLSSVAYFAAKLGTPWEEAVLATAHGRDFDVLSVLNRGEKKLFLLLGGADSAGDVCRKLCKGGYKEVSVTVGENLSYAAERIVAGTAEELREFKSGALCLMFIENRQTENERGRS